MRKVAQKYTNIFYLTNIYIYVIIYFKENANISRVFRPTYRRLIDRGRNCVKSTQDLPVYFFAFGGNMAFFKCKMCGGELEIAENVSVIECEYCGTKQTLPRLDDERRANMYERANHFRRNKEFDKAMGVYEQILGEDTTDAEAYWSLVLCRYGIEYVEDPDSHRHIPTVNRAQFTSIYDDENYQAAIKYSDALQRGIYEAEAEAINEIQKGILAISQKEEPFDVFICYKETDNRGQRTIDSVLAQDIYEQLTKINLKVFFARITLEDILGTAYEPYIFAALNSAKVMIVVGTKSEHFNASWVRNEWSRYLTLVNKSQGEKILIPAYKDIDPYRLPKEFAHLQAQDMNKIGFMQDLVRGIKKILEKDEHKVMTSQTVITTAAPNIAPLIERVFMFLEDGDWSGANEYCERVLDQDPKNAQAYLAKLMAELGVKRRERLKDCVEPFDDKKNYKRFISFADDNAKAEVYGYIEHIKTRNENALLEEKYAGALQMMKKADSEYAYRMAAISFGKIGEYKDSKALENECIARADGIKAKQENARIERIYADALSLMKNAASAISYREVANKLKNISNHKDCEALIQQCYEKADECDKQLMYQRAISYMQKRTITSVEEAKDQFKQIPGYKDADEKIIQCDALISQIKVEEENARLEKERKAEEERLEKERRIKQSLIEEKKQIKKKKIKRILLSVTIIAIVVLCALILEELF